MQIDMEQNNVAVNAEPKKKKVIKWWYPAKGLRASDRDKWASTYYRKFMKPTISFRISPASYFDNRVMIHIDLLWISWYIHLPIYSNIEECEYPEFGFYYHSNSLVLCWNMKKKFIHMPWTKDWVRTSALRKDDTWEHEVRGDRKSFYEDKWKEMLWEETYHCTYVTTEGVIQDDLEATVQVREREWRQKWLKWTKMFSNVERSIDVNFNNEVGNQRGSWKGGVLGCGETMKKGETPLRTLRRMMKERNFDR